MAIRAVRTSMMRQAIKVLAEARATAIRQLIHVKVVPPSLAEDCRQGSRTIEPHMFGDRSTIRKLAGYLLVVWLFALGAGFAHACALASPVAASEQAELGLHGHASAGDVGEAICLKFSDDAKAIANSLQPGSDPSGTALPVSVATLRIVDKPLVAASTNARTRWQADRPRLPVSIAYLRLVL